jgi:ABC-type nitrate/sulfonate/bicarbonate transport system substrate-binding protein
MTKLTIGYVPEHFSTPLFFAKQQGFYEKEGLDVEFVPFPSGSGHLIQSLQDGSISK